MESMSRYYAFNLLYALLISGSLAYVCLSISDASKNRLKVGFYLVKLIPKTIIGISSHVSRLVFRLTTHSLVLITNLIRTLTRDVKAGLQLLAESTRSLISYLLQLFWEFGNVLVSAVVKILKEAASKSGEAAAKAMSGITEKMKEGVEALKEVIKENANSMVEMAREAVSDQWSNLMDALNNDKEKEE